LIPSKRKKRRERKGEERRKLDGDNTGKKYPRNHLYGR
jgi:hypothetical protein